MMPRSPSASGSSVLICAAATRSRLKLPIRLISMTRRNASSGSGPSRPNEPLAPRSHDHEHIDKTDNDRAPMATWFYGITVAPLATATAVNFTAPLFATIAAVLVLHEDVRLRRWSAVGAGARGGRCQRLRAVRVRPSAVCRADRFS